MKSNANNWKGIVLTGFLSPLIVFCFNVKAFSQCPATASNTSPVCAGGNVNLSSSAGTSYSWSGPNGFTSSQQNPIISNASSANAGSYTVIVTDANSCIASASTIVTVRQNPSLLWQKTFGGTGDESPKCVIQTTDSGLIIAGNSGFVNGDVTFNNGSADFWVVKTDALGILQWQKSLGGSGVEYAVDIVQTTDGGYAVTGRTNSSNGDVTGYHGSDDAWVIKLDASGNLLWQRAVGGSNIDAGHAIVATDDNGVVVVGYTTSSDGDISGQNGGADVLLFKLNSNGSIAWQKCIGTGSGEIGNAIAKTADGGFIISGYQTSDFYVVKTDGSGNVIWTQTYGGSAGDFAFGVCQLASGDYLVSGYTGSSDGQVSGQHGSNDVWVIRINSSGGLVWQKCLGGTGNDSECEVIPASDGGILVFGSTNSTNGDVTGNHSSTDAWLLKLTSNGTLEWQRPLGGTLTEEGTGVGLTLDGGIIICSSVHSNDGDVTGNHATGTSDFWLLKMSYAGISGSSTVSTCNGTPVILTANPASSWLWSTGATTQSISVLAAGNYSVTVDNCFTGASVSVIHLPVPPATASSNSPVCEGSTLNLFSSGGTGYSWTGSNGFTSSLQNPVVLNVTLVNAGTYIVTVTNAIGCTSSSTTIITVNPLPLVTASTSSIACFGDRASVTVSASGGTPPYNVKVAGDWSVVSCGAYHTVAIKADNTLWAWGWNVSGQLGDGTTINKNIPVQIGSSTNWSSVSCGNDHTIAIKTDGTLWAWGRNNVGQLADGTNIQKNSPVQIGSSTDWINVSSGGVHTIAIKTDGTLWAWGLNTSGQLGDGTIISKNIPVQIGSSINWASVSSGRQHTIAIKTDGTLWAWGNNNNGQLGDGTTINKTSPIQIGSFTNWSSVSCGNDYTIAIKTDGSLWAWGSNYKGQLGDGTTINKTSPIQIGSSTDWINVFSGVEHTVAIIMDGTLWAWGRNSEGQLGDGTNIQKNIPVQIGSSTNWASVSSGVEHTIAIKTDGTLWAWGYNFSGQLGDGTNVKRYSPVQVNINNGTGLYTGLGGGSYTFIVTDSVGCTGSKTVEINEPQTLIVSLSYNPILCNSDSTKVNVIIQGGTYPYSPLLTDNWTRVSAGGFHTQAINNDGTLWAWGSNLDGQLGDGTYNTIANNPVQIGSSTNWSSVSCGNNHTIAIKTDATLWAWGYNSNGQLGDGTTINKTSPIQIGSSSNWSSVSCGSLHTIAIKMDGSLWAWGWNGSGQLGDGTNIQKNSPVQIGSSTNWASVSSGGQHTIAIKNDGTLWAWGSNTYGQLGDGTNISKNIPVQIGTSTNWSSVTCGSDFTIAIQTNGTLWAWGRNVEGQLGDGTNTQKNNPVQIGSSTNWTRVDCGHVHSVAIKTDGTLWAWGNNTIGQLGDGTNISKNIPVQIGSSTTWSMVSCGYAFTIAIKTDSTFWAWGRNEIRELGDGSTINKRNPIIPFHINTYTNVYAGIYTYSVTDLLGCNDSTSLTLLEPPTLSLSAGSNSPVCMETSLNLSTIASGGTGTITYVWSGPNGFASSQQNPIISNITSANAGTYTATVTDANSCTASASTVVTVIAFSNPSLIWQKTFGGTGDESPRCIIQTSDSGFIMAGNSGFVNGDVTFNNGGADFWVVKTDALGILQWQKSLGGSGVDYAVDIVQTTDGGYAVTGSTNSSNGDVTGYHGGDDAWVIKLDASGNLLWQRAVGGSNIDAAHAIVATADNGVVVAGYTLSSDGDISGNNGNADVLLFKLNSSGSIVWQKCIGTGNGERGQAIAKTTDAGFIVSGYTDGNGGSYGGSDFYVVKTDGNGNVHWTQRYGGSSGDFAFGICQLATGDYVVSGYTGSSDGLVSGQHGSNDVWVIRINGTGGLVWQKCLGGTGYDGENEVILSNDGGILVFGSTNSTNGDVTGSHGNYDAWLLKLTSNGTLEWQRPLGGTLSEEGVGLGLTHDGGIIICSSVFSNDGDVTGNHLTGTSDFWLLKMSYAGISGSSTVSTCSGTPVILTANPANSWLWSTGATTQSISVSAAGFYSVTTDNCFTSTPTEITVLPTPSATASSNSPVCEASILNLFSSGGTGYSWMGPNGFSSSLQNPSIPNADSSNSGTYSVTVSDGNTWLQKNNFGATGRRGAISFAIGTNGYMGTGHDGSYKNDFWEYDPLTNIWTQKADYGGGTRAEAVGFAIGTKGYVCAGFDASFIYRDLWEYNPSANSWIQKSDFGGSWRQGAAAFVIGTKGYVGTGADQTNSYKNDLWEYNPVTNLWSQKQNFGSIGRVEGIGFAIGIKGYMGTGYSGTQLNDFYEYDPIIDSWTQKNNFSGVVTGAIGFAVNTKGYVGGGYSPFFGYINSFFEYNPSSDIWTYKGAMGGVGRWAATGFALGSKGYIGTGFNGSSNQNDFWEYTPTGSCTGYASTNITILMKSTYYADVDTDSYGDTTNTQQLCAPSGIYTTTVGGDCNDTNFIIHPGTTEICNDIDDNCDGIIDESCPVTLILKVYIEGLYLGGNTMIAIIDPINYPTRCDTIDVKLHYDFSPYEKAVEIKSLLRVDGISEILFPPAIRNHSYYIVVGHRNAIETWSKDPVLFNASVKNFDFTNY